MRRRPARASSVALALALTLPPAARADAPAADAAPATRPAASAPSAPLTLASVAWLAGSWGGTTEGVAQEEVWLAPAGGLMLGLHRDVSPRGASFEYLRIEQDAQGVVYHASPGGAPPTPFRLVEATPTRAVFANPQHDFPKRIVYALDGDALTARVEGDGPDAMEWTWRRR